MRKPALTTALLSVTFLVAGALVSIPAVWAKPPACDRDKPDQYDPACVCPEEIREFAISGRLPTYFVDGSPVSVYPQGGAEYVICRPPPSFWNDSMVYASMGTVKLEPNETEGTIVTVADQLEIDDDGTLLSEIVNGAGYGLAVVAPPQLLSVPSREADLARLVEVVQRILRTTPPYSYVVGLSQGAIPATRLLESSDPRLFSGGISACGPIGNFGSVPDGQMQPAKPPLFFNQVEYWAQFLVIVDYFFPELRLLRDTSPPFVELPRVPVSTLATWDEEAVQAVFGDSANAIKVFRLLYVMWQLGLPVAIDLTGRVPPEETLAELLTEMAFLVNDYVADLGGSTFDNSYTEYPDPGLNVGVRRYRATLDTSALSPYETSGLLPEGPPLVALHNRLDHRTPYTHVPLYGRKSKDRPNNLRGPFIGFPIPLRGIPSYGHCDFTAEVAGAAFQCLVGIVERGLPPFQACTVLGLPQLTSEGLRRLTSLTAR